MYLESIFKVLKKVDVQVDVKKCTWCPSALEFFGFGVVCNVYQPLKSGAKFTTAPPSSSKQDCIFHQVHECYQESHSGMLKIKPITKLTKKGN